MWAWERGAGPGSDWGCPTTPEREPRAEAARAAAVGGVARRELIGKEEGRGAWSLRGGGEKGPAVRGRYGEEPKAAGKSEGA